MLTLNLEDGLNGSVAEKDKKKKQKLVKHRRKNWAKTDISDVERGIDELRQEELSGGVRAEKKDDELFFINKTKLKIDEETESVEPPKKKKLTLEEKMKNLNCYKNLQPDPHSAPSQEKPMLKPKENSRRQATLVKNNEVKYSARLQAKCRQKTVVNDKENDDKAKERFYVLTESKFEKNIWKPEKEPEPVVTDPSYIEHTKEVKPKKPKNPLARKTVLPTIQAPHPGMSYNPDYDDHQDLLLNAHVVELQKLNEEQKMMKRMRVNLKKMSWQEIESLWVEEMSCNNLFEEDEKEELNDEVERPASSESASAASKEKKTAKQKKKLLVEKLKQKQKDNEKKMRVQQNEIYRLKSIKKEINEKQKERDEKNLKKEIEKKHHELFGTKRLGSLKYEEPELEVKLSDELTGNLRNLKPEGNILLDRYKSLQKRNIIEPRQKAKRYRKYSKKRFEKKNAHEKTYGL